MKTYDIVVVGGGLVGASFALAAIKQNAQLKIAIIEREEPDFSHNQDGFDNKIYAISPNNINKLESLGINIDYSRVGSINEMNVRGNRDSAIIFDKYDCNSNFLAKIIEYRNLQSSIVAEINTTNINTIYTEIIQVEQNSEEVIIQTEAENIHCKWLVAADGANSYVRTKFNFLIEEIPYYQSGVVANFECVKSHNNVAHQWFTGEGILAYLPLPENKISIVWSSDKVQELLSLEDEQFTYEVANQGKFTLGELKLITKPMAFPLKLRLVDKFYNNRVILIGDAAHTIHPLAGQGVNIGFGDAWLLANLLAKKNNINLDSADLARFNSLRMIEVRKMQMTCHLLHRLFHNRNNVIDKIRNFGLNFVNNIPVVKKALINSAINY